jgi:transcriptional antiterminator
MKLEIDLNDIFRDENGIPEESLEDSIKRQVLEKLSGDLRKRLFSRLDEELSKVMTAQIQEVMKAKMPELIDDIMNTSYIPISGYGSRGEKTTFRDELVKAVTSNMKYEPKNYTSDENVFTRSVKSILEAKTSALQKAITDQVDVKFKEDAIKFAVTKLAERLGLK